VNDLGSDPVLRRNYQIWLFQYNTGNPILYSGRLLKSAIADLVHDLDPKRESAPLRDIVVMGHSQGGLLAKLLVVDSGDEFWNLVFDDPPDEVDLDPTTRELMEGSLLVRPLPDVTRVIFLSTPHHGSVLANLGLANLLGRAVRTPANLVTAVGEIVTNDPESKIQRRLSRSSGAVGNMSPNSAFIQILAPLPIAPTIHAHSIMGVKKGPKEEGTDGVVTYESAHLDDVESELVVESAHSSQSNPLVVREVRRILIEHLGEAIELGIVSPD
jgi:pimeloyl-ACP methyl ester carboxylesterase